MMSNPKSNRPLDKNPPDRSAPLRRETNISNKQQNPEEDLASHERQQRSYTGNSERSGQQYSNPEEGNSSQIPDELNTRQRSQKNELDQSHGSEFSRRESRQHARGMNSPGMKNDQEMHRSTEKRNLTEKQDRKTDLTDR